MPNKFPALQVEGTLDREGEGMFDRMNGIGAHEVIIETPDHDQVAGVDVRGRDRARAVGVPRADAGSEAAIGGSATSWCSRTTARRPGATLEHAHSQLIALPIVPDFVREELEGAQRHFAAKERCVFCDIVRQELRDGRRVIQENADIVALAPYAPRFRVRDVAAAAAARRAVRGGAAARVREPGADAEVGAACG